MKVALVPCLNGIQMKICREFWPKFGCSDIQFKQVLMNGSVGVESESHSFLPKFFNFDLKSYSYTRDFRAVRPEGYDDGQEGVRAQRWR